jgi:hypothetical protein
MVKFQPCVEGNCGKPFRMPGKFITEDGHSVDDTTGLEVSLDFFRCRTVVDLRGRISRINDMNGLLLSTSFHPTP